MYALIFLNVMLNYCGISFEKKMKLQLGNVVYNCLWFIHFNTE